MIFPLKERRKKAEKESDFQRSREFGILVLLGQTGVVSMERATHEMRFVRHTILVLDVQFLHGYQDH